MQAGRSSHFLGLLIPYRWMCYRLPVRRQTYDYLHRCKCPLADGRYSFHVPQRVGGWVGLSGWLYLWTVTRLNTTCNCARHRVPSMTWPTPLRQGKPAYQFHNISRQQCSASRSIRHIATDISRSVFVYSTHCRTLAPPAEYVEYDGRSLRRLQCGLINRSLICQT